MQDAHSIAVFDDRVRICAIDGCTPVARTPSVAGVNGASYAAGLLSYALLDPSDVTGIIESCNAHLYALGEHVSARSRPQASVAVVDLFPHKSGGFRLECYAAGDAEVWAPSQGVWDLVCGGSGVDPLVRDTWLARMQTLREQHATPDELRHLEDELFSDPSVWVHHTPVGRFANVRIQHRSLVAPALVVATDGALLDPGAFEDLPSWVALLRERDQVVTTRIKRSDDLTIISATQPR